MEKERKERLIEAIANGLTKEEAEKSWYVNEPEAPKLLNMIAKIITKSC